MKAFVTLGTFDGVHRGHRLLLRRLRSLARRHRLRPRVVLFSTPPRFYFQPQAATPLLSTVAERRLLLDDEGLRDAIVLRFGAHWARMSHERFFKDFLLRRCGAAGLLVGPDFAFGKGRLGDIDWLRSACRSGGLRLSVLPMVGLGGTKVSSSRIRGHLLRGEVEDASELLGRPYRLQGRVIRGRGLGRRIGVPTANLAWPAEKIAPPGVHEVRVTGPGALAKGRRGACNVGTRPTVDGGRRVHVEVHVPSFSGSLYGASLTLDFIRRLRPERRFDSLEALKAQILRDIRRVA